MWFTISEFYWPSLRQQPNASGLFLRDIFTKAVVNLDFRVIDEKKCVCCSAIRLSGLFVFMG
jgi:hypothetical protein